MEYNFWITAIGLLAQVFFSARVLVQWVMSERANKVLSPAIFWIFSVTGSYLLFIYGWLREDFSIIFGQLISFYIYIWNLKMKGIWKAIPEVPRIILIITPIIAMSFLLQDAIGFMARFIYNENVPLWLLIFGSIGQVLFTLRFVYQWLYSRKYGESILPAGFWIISLIGSALIVTYGILRLDIVLILGQSFGMVAYVCNLYLLFKNRKKEKHL